MLENGLNIVASLECHWIFQYHNKLMNKAVEALTDLGRI